MGSTGPSEEQDGLDLHSYHVSYETGCMLEDPLKSLPPYFEPWNDLARRLPTLVEEKRVREEVNKLPLLDHTQLTGYRQWRLAHLQLTFITAGYVWQDGDKGVSRILPRCLAVPLYKTSEKLGIQPILSHVDLALSNYALIDQAGPLEFENLKCLYHLPGGWAADWFAMVTFMVEFNFAKTLKPLKKLIDMLACAKSRETKDCTAVANMEIEMAKCLQEMSADLKGMQAALARMRDHLDGKTFFNIIRPFLGGWGGDDNPLPDGLIYEGISETPIKMTGGSAAQSTSLQVMDAMLGVEHTPEKRQFLIHMRDHMPPAHRRLIEDLEQKPYKLRDYLSCSKNSALSIAYNQCLTALIELRDYHIQVVKMYIIVPSSQANEGNFESLDKKGTGGTSLIPFLKDLRTDTADKILPDVPQNGSLPSSRDSNSNLTRNVLITAAAVVAVAFAARALIRQ